MGGGGGCLRVAKLTLWDSSCMSDIRDMQLQVLPQLQLFVFTVNATFFKKRKAEVVFVV